MSAMLPAAVNHLKQYPAKTLDSGTLRILHTGALEWLGEMDRITKDIEQKVAKRLCEKAALDNWFDIFNDDIINSRMARDTIARELSSRGLPL